MCGSGSWCTEKTEELGMREAKAVSAQESSQLRAVSCSPLSPLAYLGVAWGALQGLAFLGFQVLYVMSYPSLLASLRLGYLSPGALSHLPTPRSRKPVLTCWLTLVETPLLLPRQYHHLLHSQPLGARHLPMGALPTSMPLAVAPALLHLEAFLWLAKPRFRPSQQPQPVGC